MIAKIIIDLKVQQINRLFDYFVAPKDQEIIEKGMRVYVPFGGQKRLGYVIEIVEESELAEKEIIEILDVIPTINAEMFQYIDYLIATNYDLMINAIHTVVPNELFLIYEKKMIVKNHSNLSSDLKILIGNRQEIILNSKFNVFKKEIKQLYLNNEIEIESIYKQKGKTKSVNTLVYNEKHHYKRASNYLDLINYVIENENQTRNEVVNNGFSLSSINTLIKHEVFLIESKTVKRTVDFIDQLKIPDHKLNTEQKQAYEVISNNLNKNNIYLLHGITGSGKTEVYMQLMRDVLKQKQTILYLVPEIALIAPLMHQLKSRFNEEIIHYNSNISTGERFDSWQSIINNEARIIVGTRSAIFLPIKNLGLIVIDEEHDHSFIQTDGTEYKTIDIAKIKSKIHNAPIILGSATPSVTTMFKAQNKEYTLLKLTKRATKQNLPKIHYIDMKEELKQGNTKIFSNILFDSIKDRLKKQEQIILLFNRKGYAPFTMCRKCGYVPKCPNCDISLTYYKNDDELKCHYCGHNENNIKTCPSCNQDKIKPIGIGIEHVEYQVKKHFKEAKVIRMDATTTTKKGSHEQIWNDFKNKKYDILIGTQMVSKGLDFPNVTLVGILMADLNLKTPSYFASEQTYALLTQMSGRSGRTMFGEAIIQGYNLEHYAIKAVDKGYDYFYKEALYERKIANYTPYLEVAQILVTSQSYLKAYQVAFKLKKNLTGPMKHVLGPAESIVRYVKEQYRFVITIKNEKMDYELIFNEIKKLKGNDINIYFHNIPEIL